MKLTKKIKTGLLIVLMIAIFLILNFAGFSKGVKNFFYFISSPIQKKLWQVGDNISDFFGGVAQSQKLKRENEELNLKIQELLAENTNLKELGTENQTLREALGIGLQKEFKLVLGEIVGKDFSENSILIDKGSLDGISVGMPVITQQKILLGKINEVFKNYSMVMLISNKESSFDAKISESDIEGVAHGEGRFLLFDRIPREEEIKKGDLVVTISLGGVFPEGILVGEISEVNKSDLDPFQQAEVDPAFDSEDLDKLFIITSF